MDVHLTIPKEGFASRRRACSQDRIRLLTCAEFAVHNNDVPSDFVGFRWKDYDFIIATDLLLTILAPIMHYLAVSHWAAVCLMC